MTITERISELNKQRKGLESLLNDFLHLEGKHCSRNQKAFQSLYLSLDDFNQLSPQNLFAPVKGKKTFQFDGLRDLISTTKERIHQLDTIDTLDLQAYIASVKAVIAEKDAIREALKGENYHLAKQELDKLTGYNL